jgi:hypothetical protein
MCSMLGVTTSTMITKLTLLLLRLKALVQAVNRPDRQHAVHPRSDGALMHLLASEVVHATMRSEEQESTLPKPMAAW